MGLGRGSGKVAHEGARIYLYDSLKGDDGRVLCDDRLRRRGSFRSRCRSRRLESFDKRGKFCLDASDQWMDNTSGDGH